MELPTSRRGLALGLLRVAGRADALKIRVGVIVPGPDVVDLDAERVRAYPADRVAGEDAATPAGPVLREPRLAGAAGPRDLRVIGARLKVRAARGAAGFRGASHGYFEGATPLLGPGCS